MTVPSPSPLTWELASGSKPPANSLPAALLNPPTRLCPGNALSRTWSLASGIWVSDRSAVHPLQKERCMGSMIRVARCLIPRPPPPPRFPWCFSLPFLSPRISPEASFPVLPRAAAESPKTSEALDGPCLNCAPPKHSVPATMEPVCCLLVQSHVRDCNQASTSFSCMPHCAHRRSQSLATSENRHALPQTWRHRSDPGGFTVILLPKLSSSVLISRKIFAIFNPPFLCFSLK